MILPIETPINKSPVNTHAIIKVVKLAVTRHINVSAIVLFCKSADIIYLSAHMIFSDLSTLE
ncbi:hypothetical protein OAD13_01160 [Candidatus Pelagibacter sp.]|nr:hypothetical protein [Candidatus Pelagibacter sp.]